MTALVKYALIAFVVSLIAGGLGFSGISSAAGGIAKTLFFVFLVLAVILLLLGTVFVKAVT